MKTSLSNFPMVTCLNCRCVSIGVPFSYAKNQVKEFNTWFNKQTMEVRSHYGNNRSSIKNYRCCKYMSLVPYKQGDCPIGVTIGPVIYEPKTIKISS